MRNITITKHEEFDDVTAQTRDSVNRVIGYLSLWALHNERYRAVAIYLDKRGEANATYRNDKGEVTYSIFAQRHDDGTYSTHS